MDRNSLRITIMTQLAIIVNTYNPENEPVTPAKKIRKDNRLIGMDESYTIPLTA